MIRPLLRPVRWSRKRRRLSADCDLIAGRMDGFRGTIALLSHHRFLPGRDENGIMNKCEQIRRGPSGQWGQFCFLSCAFNYLLGPMGRTRSRYGEPFAWRWCGNNYILLTVRANSLNWYREHEVSAGLWIRNYYSAHVSSQFVSYERICM